MGRPDQGNKAETPVGYSHGTGVSTGGLATAVLEVVARDTTGVHGVVSGLRRYGAPWECYTGLPGQRANGVPVAPGILDGKAVAAGIMKAEGAILGLFQENGLQDPQGVVHSENQWRHHGYHAYPGVDAKAALAAALRGGLLIALWADVFAAEEVRDIVDIVPGKAMALDVVTVGGTLTVINVHGPGSGGDSWASKASFWANVAMYAAAKSAGGTRAVLLGGDFNVWLEFCRHPTTRRFQALWEQCGFHRPGPEREEDRRPTRAGHGWTPSF